MEDEEGEAFGEYNYDNSCYLNRRAARPHGSASQLSLSFGSQRSMGSGRSHSLGIMSMAHRQSRSDHLHHASVGSEYFNKTNETFLLGPHFPLPSVPPRSNGNGIGGGVGNVNGNPFLDLSAKLSAVTAAAAPPPVLHPPQGNGASALASALATATAATAYPNRKNSAASVSSEEDTSAMAGDFSMMMKTKRHRSASSALSMKQAPSALASSAAATTTTSGPSELYRLIASPPPPGGDPPDYWDVVLNRANEHPHEACFYDPNAGGHVYALHRLLRRATWGEEDDEDDDDHEDDPEDYDDDRSSSRRRRRRPPVSVVEAVMRACPRAVTRKQAVVDEDALLVQSSSATTTGGGDDGNGLRRMSSPPLALLPAAVGDDEGRAGGRGPPRPEGEEDVADATDDDDERDDVRFEYPLAIACECRQDGEVVRLLASYLGTAAPAYRSEVYRSLDYASLPNHVVRILLEEHAGCVVERGTNSEATEGDDDDCPLEQVLFWWDDPDMMGMEDDILSYPNCDMGEDLRDLWEKLRMMLYAATYGKMAGYDDSKGSFQVLHRLMRIVSTGGIGGVRFPNDFAHAVVLLAKFIQRERRSMFEERDETGSLPLHIAVSGDSLLRQNDHPSRMMIETGRDDERGEDGAAVDQGDAGQHESDAQMDQAVGGVVRADDGDLAAGGEARQLDNRLLPPPAGGLLAGAELAVEDEDDEEDSYSEAGDNAEEGDNEDIDTSAMPSDMELIRLLLDQYPASIRLRDSQSGSLPIHLILRHNPRAIDAIELFLDLYPRSVTMPDGNGRLPIHLAIIQKSPTWNKVLSMSPIALEARDPVTGLVPFQLAAMSKPAPKDSVEGPTSADEQDQDELESLSTCYSLLRMSPCLAFGLADIKPSPQSPIEQQIMVRYKPRVTKLEEENERLRRRVEELELKLASMQIAEAETCVLAMPSGSPHLKKRKSSAASPDIMR